MDYGSASDLIGEDAAGNASSRLQYVVVVINTTTIVTLGKS